MALVMDPSQRDLFMPDERRLTQIRAAGFALEASFVCVHTLGLYALTLAVVATVEIERVALGHPGNPKRTITCSVTATHQQAVLDATADIVPRLHQAGYAIVGVKVPQRHSASQHDLVLEFRRPGSTCAGQYSAELKLRTAPANRALMRSDCSKLFTAACKDSAKWLGQLIIVAEVSKEGRFLRSRAELLVRGRPRTEALNVWGWDGRPCTGPPLLAATRPTQAQHLARHPRPQPGKLRRPRRAVAPRAWSEVWTPLEKYDASWTDEKVVLLKAFVEKAGLAHLVTHASRIIKENRSSPLRWRLNVDYGKALDKEHGRVEQGGAAAPWVAKRTALKAYLESLR